MAIHLSFEGFAGSPEELQRALRSGRLHARELPLLDLIEQALSQVAALDLPERGALLPLLAELLERKLRALLQLDRAEDPEEGAEEGEALVGLLVELDEAVRFLMERAQARGYVWPVPAASLPRDARLAPSSVGVLYRYARRFLRPVSLLPTVERFGVAEAWAWLRRRLAKLGRGWFSSLGLETWSERTVTFAALLEAVRQGQVRLRQKGTFADLWIEIEPEQEERSA
ncbi:MAG TPA: chromosome segregation protein ScpA [Oceanithermus profundus]|uniref:Chromosome segregation protein ScpA n=1 Tax=Oceanithermus profundus TaxID=187137 RepID=A0A7C4V553_9DEIN|nr:chromosome segregation protein ScpA [Oceanithermus profundus]